jgi:hypothetical protein
MHEGRKMFHGLARKSGRPPRLPYDPITLFDLAIDSKLRGYDIVKMKIGAIVTARTIRNRATAIQQKTGRAVQLELMTEARKTLLTWLERRVGSLGDYIVPSRVNGHLAQVLACGGKVELVFCAIGTPQAQAIQLEDALEMGKQHLDLL